MDVILILSNQKSPCGSGYSDKLIAELRTKEGLGVGQDSLPGHFLGDGLASFSCLCLTAYSNMAGEEHQSFTDLAAGGWRMEI